eukprot:Blabericola_migrator_1__3566@NODE_205_length_11429_cov_258_680338_g176_i0_p1_GENE_NODE_205_length_11429_cov_258_680338_g176_i0NODE_205_length_11429_cov_258_680338_g176_i0_p1_ORF_typecomplete_len1220_score230_36DNA_pol_B_exo1/PF03104_19/4_2e14DNA_pol_B_exo1/PF03104_19/1e14DNA_pol_B/PF00136_21/5_7e23_NODE_205_length_11429_cov_258_680338_g176_i033937052
MNETAASVVSVRAIHCDYYLIKNRGSGPPAVLKDVGFAFRSPLSGREFPHIPVIRLYGPSLKLHVSTSSNKRVLIPGDVLATPPHTPPHTPTHPLREDDEAEMDFEERQVASYCRRGPSCILHIFSIFPYFYSEIPQSPELPTALCQRCDGDAQQSLDWRQLSPSHRRRPVKAHASSACCELRANIYSYFEQRDLAHLIWDMYFVARTNIYGYHSKPQLFLKYLVSNPSDVAVLGKELFEQEGCQVFNLHIPYLVQFMSDWGVSGPDFVSFLPDLVRLRPSNEKTTKNPLIQEYDLLSPCFLLHLMNRDGTGEDGPTPVWQMEVDYTQDWDTVYRERYKKDFDAPGAPSATESLSQLWLAEYERRLKGNLLSTHPLKPVDTYIATKFDNIQKTIPLKSTLPDNLNDLLDSVMNPLMSTTPAPAVKKKRELELPNDKPLKYCKTESQQVPSEASLTSPQSLNARSNFAGYVCYPYWSDSADLEFDRLQSFIPQYYLQPSSRRSMEKKATSCPRCRLTKGEAPSSITPDKSGPFSIINSWGTFHDCSFFKGELIDQCLGRAVDINEKKPLSQFIYSRRPPCLDLIRKEVESQRQEISNDSKKTTKSTSLDVSESPLSSSRYLTPKKRLHDGPGNENTIFEEVSARRLSRLTSTSSKDLLRLYHARAAVLSHKTKVIIGNYVPNSLRGLAGRMVIIENILSIYKPEHQSLNTLSQALNTYERATRSRGDPEVDQILCSVLGYRQLSTAGFNEVAAPMKFIILYQSEDSNPPRSMTALLNEARESVTLRPMDSEKNLIREVFTLLSIIDPSIIAAWDVRHDSLGYILKRAAVLWGTAEVMNLASRLHFSSDRVLAHDTDPSPAGASPGPRHLKSTASISVSGSDDRAFERMTSRLLKVEGRLLLNGWRVLKSDVKVMNFSFENVLKAVCQRVLPHISPHILSAWWQCQVHTAHPFRCNALKHIIDRILCFNDVLEKTECIAKSATMGQVFGLDLFSVLTRGSQFFVEALLCRAAQRLGYVLLSASKSQVHGQDALEAIPMVLEPRSSFYFSPVIVVDYQSLYPSLIIGYNLCYSTCLGKIHLLRDAIRQCVTHCATQHQPGDQPLCQRCVNEAVLDFKFGVCGIQLPLTDLLQLLNNGTDGLYVTPNGSVFLAATYRRGILPAMLRQILSTRIMLKQSMKVHDIPALKKTLNHQQFSLKFVSNVTLDPIMSGFVPMVDTCGCW